jgi:hypothetical protein
MAAVSRAALARVSSSIWAFKELYLCTITSVSKFMGPRIEIKTTVVQKILRHFAQTLPQTLIWK